MRLARVTAVSAFVVFLSLLFARPVSAQGATGLCQLTASWTDEAGVEQTHTSHVNAIDGSAGFSVLEGREMFFSLQLNPAALSGSSVLENAFNRGELSYIIRQDCDRVPVDLVYASGYRCDQGQIDRGPVVDGNPVIFYGNATDDDNESGNYEYVVNVFREVSNGPDNKVCSFHINSTDAGDVNTDESDSRPSIERFAFCEQIPAGTQRDACLECLGAGGFDGSNPSVIPEDGRLYTAVGCIRTSQSGLTADLVSLLLGISGGVALLSTIAAAFYYTTSQGDSNKVKKAKEYLTSSVAGLFFIIFVVIILDFIGVQILRIPGLG